MVATCKICKHVVKKQCLLHEPNGTACTKRLRRLRRRNSLAADDLEHRRIQRRASRGTDPIVSRKEALNNSKVGLAKHKLSLLNAVNEVQPSGIRLGVYFARSQSQYYDEPIVRAVGQYSLLLERLTSDDVVLDVGGNVGVFSVEAALRGCKVKTFEPCHDHVVLLRQHAIVNRVHKLISSVEAAVVGNAADNAANHVKLYLSNGINNGSHTILPTRGRRAQFVRSVPAHKAFRTKFTAAKIDCEGAEYDFLDYLLLKCQTLRLLIVELHLKTKNCQCQAAKFVNEMKARKSWRALRSPNLKSSNWTTLGCWERRLVQ